MPFINIEVVEPRILYTASAIAGFDVSVLSSTIPSLLVIGGKKIHGTVGVQLEGSSGYAEKGNFAITIDADLNGVFTPLATVKRRLEVSADIDSILKIPVGPIGKIVTPGNYAIYAEVKDHAALSEISAGGPTLVAQPRTYAFSETLVAARNVSIFESDDYITGLVEAYTLQI